MSAKNPRETIAWPHQNGIPMAKAERAEAVERTEGYHTYLRSPRLNCRPHLLPGRHRRSVVVPSGVF